MNSKFKLFLLFTLLMISAAGLRFFHINSFGLFGDEKQSILIAVGNTNFGGMKELMQPPKSFTPSDFWTSKGINAWLDADARGDVSGNSLVHDMALKLFSHLFGKSDASLRSVSVFFNLLTLWLIFIWARKLKFSNYYWPLGILFLGAIEPFFVIFSQQARNYTTSLFFATLSNYFFWNIINLVESKNSKNGHLIGWIMSSILAFFSTYLTAIVLIGQFLFVLIIRPQWQIWKKLMIASFAMLIPIGLWMTKGPGQYFYNYQKDAGQQYLNYLKLNGPISGWIEPSTLRNLFVKTVSIISDNFFWTNDLYNRHGFKLGTILIVLFLLLVFKWVLKIEHKAHRYFYLFGLLQIMLPIFVLNITAINAGTTTGFFLRYASFGLPFGIFISVGFLDYLVKLQIWYRFIGILIAAVQVYFLIQSFKPIYFDEKQKYTASSGRQKNPYPFIAQKISTLYETGDTVLYPSYLSNFFNSVHIKSEIANVSDAQLTNLYLSENSTIIQKINIKSNDSILIKKKNGKYLLIFDFNKNKFRY